MNTSFPMAVPMPAFPFAELRVDVQLPAWGVESELRRLQARMQRAGDALCGLPMIPSPLPGFAFRFREADGELYVYVEDIARHRLAGYTVFNRLVELGRRADSHLRGPHSRYSRDYQRRGIATAVYRWALDRGMCLITGARQSAGAHALWRSLSTQYEPGYVELRDRKLRYLGRRITPALLDDLHTRMLLLGRRWTLERFAFETGALLPEDAQLAP